MIVEELLTKWGFEINSEALTTLSSSLNTIQSNVLKLGAAAVGAGATMFGFAKFAANAADQVYDTSVSLGIGTRFLQEFGYVAQLSGSSFEEASTSLRFLNRNVGAAIKGSDEAQKAFKSLGIPLADLKRMDTQSVIMRIADQFQKLPAGATKSALAMQLFGRGGSSIIQTLDQGSAGMQKLINDANALGGVMDDRSIAIGNAFNDAYDSIMFAMKGLRNTIGIALIPELQKLANTFIEWYKVNKDWIALNITDAIKSMGVFVELAWYGFTKMVDTIGLLTGLFGGFGNSVKIAFGFMALLTGAGILAGIGGVVMGIWAIVAGWTAANTQLVITWALTIGWALAIGAAIALFFIAMDDLLTWFRGGDSIFGALEKWIYGFGDGFATTIQVLVAIISTPLRYLVNLLDSIWSFAKLVTGQMSTADFANRITGNIASTLGVGSMKSFRGAFGLAEAEQKPILNQSASSGLGIGPLLPSPGGAGGRVQQSQQNNITMPVTVNVGENVNPSAVGGAAGDGISTAIDNIMRGSMRMFEAAPAKAAGAR